MLNGFINLYKEKGITSNKTVSILKYYLKQNNIQTKIGHFGTLDPLAEGVLPIALGRATRLFDYFLDKTKEYYAVVEFGIQTDTLDMGGSVVKREDVVITQNQILQVVDQFKGEIEQIPPHFSAKFVNGKRAYELARKGLSFELKPKKIMIYDISLVKEEGYNKFGFNIVCGGGAYIRALARDIAQRLNTVGMLASLTRKASGEFTVDSSVKIEELSKNPLQYILPMEKVVESYPQIIVKESEKTDLLNGKVLLFNELPHGYFALKTYEDNKLFGMGINDNGRLKVKTWLI